MVDHQTTEWTLTYADWNPEQQPLREALCTLGNGYFATRGAAEEARAGGPHYPGTYLAGGYNRLETEVSGRIVENEDLVNWPNWLGITFRHSGGEWFDLDGVEVLDFRQELDVRRGVLSRTVRFRDDDDRTTTLCSRRVVHMAQPHLAAIEWTLTPENWSGTVEIHAGLDGSVINAGVERYRALNSRHLDGEGTERNGEDGILLVVQTNQSKLRMAQAARLHVFQHGEPASADRFTTHGTNHIEQTLVVDCDREKPLQVEKVVAVYTSRDHAISEPALEAGKAVRRAPSFAALLQTHTQAWSRLWHRCDIRLTDGREREQLIMRLYLFHLLQTVSMNTIDLDVGVPSRGWHGEAYRGHVFWDELFIFPFLNFSLPELTRALLMYRYRRLPEARYAAAEEGHRGAMFPWQSGSNGREESQAVHLNPQSGRWIPDTTYRQRHVNAAIAYNIWQYFQATHDTEFLAFYGAEMFLEIARFWSSLAVYNPERDRYEIHQVVGPDEFHTAFPGREEPGLRNNAYTNVMAVWVLQHAADVLSLLAADCRSELLDRLHIDDEDLSRFDDVSRRMFIPFHDDGIISQFEGYEELEEFDWDGYRQKYGDLQRLDRILEAEDDTPNRYKVSKQADVLMLFYLFSCEELASLFDRTGYAFEPEMIPRNIAYYLERTSHGSTLSRIAHSWVLSRSDRVRSWSLFRKALESDVSDIQGGTTPEGIHLGAMAGTVDIVQRCHTDMEMRGNVLWFNPCLPDELNEVKLRIRYRGHWIHVRLNHTELTVAFESGWSPAVNIGFRDEVHTFGPGQQHTFAL